MKTLIICALALTAGTASAQVAATTPAPQASTPSGSAPSSAKAAPAAADRKICKWITSTGSRLASRSSRQKICGTKAEWDAQAEESRKLGNSLQRADRVNNCPPSGCG